MVTRWIIIHENGTVHDEGFKTEQEAWKKQVDFARTQGGSPYEWTAHAITFEVL